MLKTYVDTGGMLPVVGELEKQGLLATHYFPFEQRSRRIQNFVPGSGASWEQSNLSWAEDPGSWNDDEHSPLFGEILRIVRKHVDAQHLDSAYKSGCTVFLTSDKRDIWSNREALQSLLGLTVLHMPSEIDRLQALVRR